MGHSIVECVLLDWDLIRGGHYGQRSCEPHLKGRTHGCTEQACDVKKALANSEPATHGPSRHSRHCKIWNAIGVTGDIGWPRGRRDRS